MDHLPHTKAEVPLYFDIKDSSFRKLFSILNPTRASCAISSGDSVLPSLEKPYSLWTARDSRKGRHAFVVPPRLTKVSKPHCSQNSSRGAVLHQAPHAIVRMVTIYPFWYISYDVAILYSMGSIFWVLNGFYGFLPLTNPSTGSKHETLYPEAVSVIIGEIVFEIASALLLLEAANENREDCFGWAVKMVLEDTGAHLEQSLDMQSEKFTGWHVEQEKGQCRHHQASRTNLVNRGRGPLDPKPGAWNELIATSSKEISQTQGQRLQTWCLSLHEIRSHKIYSLRFLGSLVPLTAATLF